MEFDDKNKQIYMENENLEITIKIKNPKSYGSIPDSNSGKLKKIFLEFRINKLITNNFYDQYPFPLRHKINNFLPSD